MCTSSYIFISDWWRLGWKRLTLPKPAVCIDNLNWVTDPGTQCLTSTRSLTDTVSYTCKYTNCTHEHEIVTTARYTLSHRQLGYTKNSYRDLSNSGSFYTVQPTVGDYQINNFMWILCMYTCIGDTLSHYIISSNRIQCWIHVYACTQLPFLAVETSIDDWVCVLLLSWEGIHGSCSVIHTGVVSLVDTLCNGWVGKRIP